MTPAEYVEVTRDGIYVLLIVSAPPLLAALGVGLIVSLFQALTQIQEATLTFVPKAVALLLVLVLALPWMHAHLEDYMRRIAEKIVHID